MRINRRTIAAVLGMLFALPFERAIQAQPQMTNAPAGEVRILKIEGPAGVVEWMRSGTTTWSPALENGPLHPGDRIRTLEKGRVTLRWSDNTLVRLPPWTDLHVEPGPEAAPRGLTLLKGLLYFFHRERPTENHFRTRTAAAAIRGTEFVLEYIEPEDRTVLTVLDGEVELSNAQGQVHLASGEQGIAQPGASPGKTAVLEAVNIIQWFLYYPAVLDLDELELNAAEAQALAASLNSYRSGDLLGALAHYPADRVPRSMEETVYQAALWLAVGRVDQTEQLLKVLPADLDPNSRVLRLREALRQLIAAVKFQSSHSTLNSQFSTASELLAESYYQQSRSNLPEALAAARRAVRQSPRFGLAWARVAELEFSFGRTSEALAALEQSLQLASRNAQAFSLKGFLLAARNRVNAALQAFEHALELDGGLGNAWLGRGLCKIRQGRLAEGKDDLQTAVAVEPQRALLRSYLAKSYAAKRDHARAAGELRLAKAKDPADPTAWLYSTLLNQQQNRIGSAVQDLERSQELNDNRSVYRSRLLLDQDRAVRGANLASIYRDAGMFEVSVREAARAVTADPANYSAHLFLANSYYELFEPGPFQQRYEAARVNEYLTATLLSPVGAGLLSQPVSAQEYASFFERDGLGLYSSTEYLSRGAWQQYGAQYGRFGNVSYSLDAYYRTDPGQRDNNDIEQWYASPQFKAQLTPADSVFLQAVWTEADYGDLAQVYDPTTQGNRSIRYEEEQEPLLLLGYHHEWSPGHHTLLLAGRLQDTLRVTDPQQQALLVSRLDDFGNFTGTITGVMALDVDQRYQSELEIYTIEAQQIVQRERFALIGGGRYQAGNIDTDNELANVSGSSLDPSWFVNDPQEVDANLERINLYGYAHWQLLQSLRVIGGLSYDQLKHPENFRSALLSAGEETADLVAPKAGLIWVPLKDTVLRAAYSRSLGGVSIDQSFQLEPSQVAGFNQAWRSLIPESVVGTLAAAKFEQWNISLEQKWPTRTYAGIGAELLQSEAERTTGVFETGAPAIGVFPLPAFISFSKTREDLDFQERSLLFTLHQLVGDDWAFGARYRLSQAELEREYPGFPDTATMEGGLQRQRDEMATMHNVKLYGRYTHTSGLWGQGEALWFRQSNAGYGNSLSGEDIWQFNAFVGYLFPRRQAELRLGLLNITGQDYRLNPLNLISELPRERTLAVSFRFSF